MAHPQTGRPPGRGRWALGGRPSARRATASSRGGAELAGGPRALPDGRFAIGGSLIPLAMLMAVFFMRYAVNVSIAIAPALKADAGYRDVPAAEGGRAGSGGPGSPRRRCRRRWSAG